MFSIVLGKKTIFSVYSFNVLACVMDAVFFVRQRIFQCYMNGGLKVVVVAALVHQRLNTYVRVIKLDSFLTSALDRGEWLVLRSGRFKSWLIVPGIN